MPKGLRQHEHHRHESELELLRGDPAINDNDGAEDSPQMREWFRAYLGIAMQRRPPEMQGRVNDETFKIVKDMVGAGVPVKEVVGLYEQTRFFDDLAALEGDRARLTKEESVAQGHEWHPLQHPSGGSTMWQGYNPKERDKDNREELLYELSQARRDHGSKPLPPIERLEGPIGWSGMVPPGTTPWDAPGTSDTNQKLPVMWATFARALEDSDAGSTPSFSRGDLLRIVGNRRRDDPFFEVLTLKPPGEKGRALRSILEAVDEEDVAKVGKKLKTVEEKKCFRSVVEWEDSD